MGIPEVTITKDASIRDQNPQSFSSYGKLQGLKHGVVPCMLQDKVGNIWFGTGGGGLCKYDGKSFTHFTENEGLVNNNMLSIFEDKKGNLWFSTFGGGVTKFDGKFFTYYGENPNGSVANIAGICNKKRNVLGMMPHPERACDSVLGKTDGRLIFNSLIQNINN